MKKIVYITLFVLYFMGFFFPKFLQAEIIYMKDGQVIDGAIIFEDKKIIKVETDIKKWTIKKKHIKRIMYGKRKMEKIYILMNTGDILQGFLIDQDNEKIIIRREKNSSKEETILKNRIRQMSPKEIKLFEPEIMLMGGLYYPINSGGSKLNPGWLAIGAFEFNLVFIKSMRLQIEAGYSQCTSSENDGLTFAMAPLKMNLQYFFNLSTNWNLYPRLGAGGAFILYDDGEGDKKNGVRPLANGGLGVSYELIDKSIYARGNLDYAMLFDSGSNLSNLFLSLGFGLRF